MNNHSTTGRSCLRTASAALFALTACLAGCANTPPSLYNWQQYQPNVYDYLRGDKSDISTQTKTMEEGLQKIRASGGVVPPGYNAHLGLLYAKQGNLNAFASQLETEKQQYPESAVFVDFLLRNYKK